MKSETISINLHCPVTAYGEQIFKYRGHDSRQGQTCKVIKQHSPSEVVAQFEDGKLGVVDFSLLKRLS